MEDEEARWAGHVQYRGSLGGTCLEAGWEGEARMKGRQRRHDARQT